MPQIIIFAKICEACGEAFVYFSNCLRDELTEAAEAQMTLPAMVIIEIFSMTFIIQYGYPTTNLKALCLSLVGL